MIDKPRPLKLTENGIEITAIIAPNGHPIWAIDGTGIPSLEASTKFCIWLHSALLWAKNYKVDEPQTWEKENK